MNDFDRIRNRIIEERAGRFPGGRAGPNGLTAPEWMRASRELREVWEAEGRTFDPVP